MNRNVLRQIFVILAVAATIIVNALANILPINNLNTGEISDRFQVLFVPAGYVFSIWGVIYIGLIAYAVFQALPAQRENTNLKQIAIPFYFASAANIAWIFLWHYEQFLVTVPVMLVLLISLIVIYLRLKIVNLHPDKVMRWMVCIPFSIYLGWVSVATIANITSVLDYIQWNGWGLAAETWAMIMLVVATLLGLFILITRRDYAYSLVLIWAFIGIAIKQSDNQNVLVTSCGAALILIVGVLTLIFLPMVKSKNRPG